MVTLQNEHTKGDGCRRIILKTDVRKDKERSRTNLIVGFC
jgi:hypothetical protein